MLNKLFKLEENHTNVKTEVLAGITTFMTMAYILAVNPTMLSAAGMDRDSGTDRYLSGMLLSEPLPWHCSPIIRLRLRRVWD